MKRGHGISWLAAVLLTLWFAAQAQGLPQPVDPLKRPETTPGRFSFDLSLAYVPGGGSLLGVDEAKGPYQETYATHSLTPQLAASYALNKRLSLGLGLGYAYTRTQTKRRYATDEAIDLEQSEGRLVSRASLSYRLAPESPLDPGFFLSLAYPWATRASLSASWIRDPVVLSGALAYEHGFLPPYPTTLGFSLGAGFVANDRVSYALDAALSQPIAFAAPATLSASFTASYALDAEGKRELSLTLSASERAGVVTAGLSLGYRVREVVLEAAP